MILESFIDGRIMLAVNEIFLSLATDPLYRYKQYSTNFPRVTTNPRTNRNRLQDLLAFRISPRRILAAVQHGVSRLRYVLRAAILTQTVALLSKVLAEAE